MRQYTHLTEHERYHIWLMIGQQDSLTSIANRMGRSVSTISREIKRNIGKRGYRYQQAGRFAHASHQTKNGSSEFPMGKSQTMVKNGYKSIFYGDIQMKDTALGTLLLGLSEPWRITAITPDLNRQINDHPDRLASGNERRV